MTLNPPGRSALVVTLSFGALQAALFAANPVKPDFPADLYPQLKGKSEADIRLSGIAALCPGRLIRGESGRVARLVPEMRKTRVAELPRGGAYVRLYTLDSQAVRERVGKGPLIVDCRYLSTDAGQSAECLELCSAFRSEQAFSVSFRGRYGDGSTSSLGCGGAAVSPKRPPVLVLVNGKTSGPLEALLAAVQARAGIFLVGGRTAGETGEYAPLEGHPGWWSLTGEILPDGGESLVGVGVDPKFPVKVSPEDEFLAWQLVERGAPLSQVLRHESLGRTGAAMAGGDPAKGKSDSAEPADPTLQRAQDVLAALQVLGGLPVSAKS